MEGGKKKRQDEGALLPSSCLSFYLVVPEKSKILLQTD